MNILAIDIGTKTGWSMLHRDGTVKGGTRHFRPKKSESQALRWSRFRDWLRVMLDDVHVVYYEDVKAHAGVLAAHAYGGYLAILEMNCLGRNIPCNPVGVGVIKKHWTGKGNADKETMVNEAKRRGFSPVDDNHADALAILSYAVRQEGIDEK